MATNYNYPVPNEGRMAKTYLWQLEQDARALRELLGDQDDMPGWVKFYVATSADRMNTASRYMQYEATQMSTKAKKNPSVVTDVGKALLGLGAVCVLLGLAKGLGNR